MTSGEEPNVGIRKEIPPSRTWRLSYFSLGDFVWEVGRW